jgi:hypothetical protein
VSATIVSPKFSDDDVRAVMNSRALRVDRLLARIEYDALHEAWPYTEQERAYAGR